MPGTALLTLIFALTLTVASPPARGQSAAGYRRLAERLRPIIQSEEQELRRRTERRRNAPDTWGAELTDTIRAGSVIVITTADHRELADLAARLAWDTLAARLGHTAERLVEFPIGMKVEWWAPRCLIFDCENPELSRGPALHLRLHVDTTLWRFSARVPADVAPSTLANVIAGVLWLQLWAPPGDTIRQWAEGPPDALDAEEWHDVYVDLVTAEWESTSRCHHGDLAWCGAILDLDGGADPFMRWFTPADRRRIVASNDLWTRRATDEAAYTSCVVDARIAACDSYLRQFRGYGEKHEGIKFGSGLIPLPVGFLARQSLATTAIQLGGSGAVEEMLRRSDASIEHRLTAASGVSRDSLLTAWRNRVLAARPRGWAVSGWMVLTAASWCALLLAAAVLSRMWRAA